MPPPLLPRHLRPCQPSWSARHTRRASSTPRIKFSTSSDDKPGSSSQDGRDESTTVQDQKGWWSAAIDSISSLGLRRVPSDSGAQATPSLTKKPTTPNQERVTQPRSRKRETKLEGQQTDATSESDSEALPKDITSTKSAQRGSRTEKPHMVNSGRVQVTKHVTPKGTNSPLGHQKIIRTKLPWSDTSEFRPDGGDKGIIASSKAGNTVGSIDRKAIAQQLQQLLDQAKILQDALAGINGNGPLHLGANAVTSKTNLQRTAETGSSSVRSTTLLANNKITPPARRHIAHDTPEVDNLWRLAISCYRSTTTVLVSIANQLEKDKSRMGSPIVSLVRKRLAIIARDAIADKDVFMERILSKYKSAKIRNLILEELTSVDLAKSYYRRSVTLLIGLVGTLEAMKSPTVTTIASMIRDRLRVLAAEAELENDDGMRQTLQGTHRYNFLRESVIQRTLTFTPSRSGELPNRTTLKDGKMASIESTASAGARIVDSKVRGFKRLTITDQERTSPTNDFVDATESSSASDRPAENGKPTLAERMWGESNRGQRLVQHIHTRSRLMKSSAHSQIRTPTDNQKNSTLNSSEKSSFAGSAPNLKNMHPPPEAMPSQPAAEESDQVSEQSLLEELFPEVSTSSTSRYAEKRDQYQKLEPPESNRLIRRELVDDPRTLKGQVFESFQKRGEQITVLQLEYCSTELTRGDFRRLIPKGKHLEGWNRNGELLKVIPGRDPLSLERLPFYYLLFKNPESAHAYQNNATRLHKLAALHQSSNILSAIPPPRGFLEDGEDISAITASYVLKPTEHAMTLRTLMQPYHPALRALIEQGGYKPIVPDVDDKGNRIYKVLMHIEGYEPSRSDLFKIFRRDAYNRGLTLSLRNEVSSSIHRLRDIVNLKTRMHPISTTNPRAYGHWEPSDPTTSDTLQMKLEFEDPAIRFLMKGDAEGDRDVAKEINQVVMNRLYNRWLIEFDNEDEARRFATAWHRRMLPELVKGDRTWKDYEEVRMCNCELLW